MRYVESTLDNFEKEASAILAGGFIGSQAAGEGRREEGAVMGAVGGKGLALATYPIHSEAYYKAFLSDKGYQHFVPEKGPFKGLRAQAKILKGFLSPTAAEATLNTLPPEAVQRINELASGDKGALKRLGAAFLRQNAIKGGLGIAAGLGAGYLAKNYGWGDEMAAEKREEELAQMGFIQRMEERIKDNPEMAAAAGLGTVAALGGAAYYGLNKEAGLTETALGLAQGTYPTLSLGAKSLGGLAVLGAGTGMIGSADRDGAEGALAGAKNVLSKGFKTGVTGTALGGLLGLTKGGLGAGAVGAIAGGFLGGGLGATAGGLQNLLGDTLAGKAFRIKNPHYEGHDDFYHDHIFNPLNFQLR